MSNKEYFYTSDQPNITGYQEISLDPCNESPVFIAVENPEDFSIVKADSHELIVLSIPAAVLDSLAAAWCQKRALQGELGGPVGKEWGAPGWDSE